MMQPPHYTPLERRPVQQRQIHVYARKVQIDQVCREVGRWERVRVNPRGSDLPLQTETVNQMFIVPVKSLGKWEKEREVTHRLKRPILQAAGRPRKPPGRPLAVALHIIIIPASVASVRIRAPTRHAARRTQHAAPRRTHVRHPWTRQPVLAPGAPLDAAHVRLEVDRSRKERGAAALADEVPLGRSADGEFLELGEMR